MQPFKLAVGLLAVLATLTVAELDQSEHQQSQLALDVDTLTIEAGHAKDLLIMPKVAPTADVHITATSKDESIAVAILDKTIKAHDQSGLHISVFGAHPGNSAIELVTASADSLFQGIKEVRIEVIRSSALVPWIAGLGWLCFFLWSSSFYPQVAENTKRQSVVGLNLDSALWNMAGNFSYMLYNLGLFFVPSVLTLYDTEHPGSPSPVTLSDVFFALHATGVTTYIMWQAFTLDRGNQSINRISWVGTSMLLVFAVIGGVSASTGTINALHFLEVFSTVKLVCTFLRYTPQVIFNYQRQSTVGFTVETQFLDLVGGVASIMQMYLQAYNSNNYRVFGNFAKFGLALVSIGFDLTLIFQHYVLYRHSHPSRYPHFAYGDLANEDNTLKAKEANFAPLLSSGLIDTNAGPSVTSALLGGNNSGYQAV